MSNTTIFLVMNSQTHKEETCKGALEVRNWHLENLQCRVLYPLGSKERVRTLSLGFQCGYLIGEFTDLSQ